ncbi:MAG: phenylalanine--tRNA ligase subunit alpha, partial [Dehalococcoidia bacterium]|nr:phenylalanine--tRNA ligase subunit alpha [Dehalococcoidia bacterium]
AAAGDTAALEAWRVRYLGKKSALNQVMRALGGLPPEERRSLGARANELKLALERALVERKQALEMAALALTSERALDISLPGTPVLLGRLHPVTQVLREVCGIFMNMGFELVEGPDVETDYYNFEALNIPADHPARDAFSTFWIESPPGLSETPLLLRTHTSPVQIRVMEKRRPPIRIIAPGRVYRYEATDATHESMFYQIEGLAVDRGISMADLKGTLSQFARLFFGPERKIRFRCDYFPFVEPGMECAIDCFACGGKGCRMCGNSGWLEILGAGMVHPDVLRRVGIDPDVYSGFAFGMGVERMPMLKYGIDDIRLFYSNDLRFLRQF